MKKKRFLYSVAYQSFAVFLISTALALFINHFHPNGVPLVGDWSVEAQMTLDTGENIEISVQDARKLCLEGKAVILDARSPEEYDTEHIECSINVPWLSFDAHFEKIVELPDDKTIITYCDGESCNLSKDLAKALIDLGFKDVKVIVNGWSVWVRNRFPTRTGGENLES